MTSLASQHNPAEVPCIDLVAEAKPGEATPLTLMLEKDIPSSQLSQEEVPEEPPPGEKKPEEKEAGDAVQEPKSMKEDMCAAEVRAANLATHVMKDCQGDLGKAIGLRPVRRGGVMCPLQIRTSF